MQRNWDIIRKILLAVEALPTEDSEINSTEFQDINSESVAYHMRLLLDAGLIVGSCRDAVGPPLCRARHLTWEGHEFLDKIRNESIWRKIKANARDKGIDLSFTVIKDLAKVLISGLISS